MKVYIAARFGKKQEVLAMQKLLLEKGYEIIGDWTPHKTIRPYKENQELAKQYSIDDINAVRDCDVFIILSDEAGTGMYAELGAAILSNIKFGKPVIYVIGKYSLNLMFYFHPSVNRREDINQVIKELERISKTKC